VTGRAVAAVVAVFAFITGCSPAGDQLEQAAFDEFISKY
jgi:hypothetical protein